MAALPPFSDSPLSAAQIDSNYTWRNIRQTGTRLDDKVLVDLDRDLLITSNVGTTVDAVSEDVVITGTDNTNTLSDETIIIGHQIDVTSSNQVIKIGGANAGDRSEVAANSNNNIAIGYDQNIGTILASTNNIVIGNEINVTNGVQNVIIGHGAALGAVHADVIAIQNRPSQAPLAPTANGAIILGGGTAPSIRPKFQLNSGQLVGLTNGAHNAAYNPADAAIDPANLDLNGWLRLRYQGQDIRIPIRADTEDLIPPP